MAAFELGLLLLIECSIDGDRSCPKSVISSSVSDVPGLQLSGFGRAGPDLFGPRAGPGFFTSGFGLFFGLFQSIKCTYFLFFVPEIRIFPS